ncbi:MAG: tRNA (N6-threonylcarbamoyladenosine(37)-N6)-methyltransferase TrmO [Ignavibacteriota bacterium]
MELQPLTLQPIGIIRTPFTDRVDAPRQPDHAGGGSPGKIILVPGQNFEQALEDLDGFEKIWLIYQFDRNTNWKPKVLPPRADRTKRGVFATRSPHRPNPIGLSLVSLLEIDGRNIYVGGVDILDNTPIFDIKPYLPYAEAFPGAKAGWLDETIGEEDSKTEMIISLSNLADEQFQFLKSDHAIDLLQTARKTLTYDPYPHPSRRIFKEKDGEYMMAIKSWRILYCIEADHIVIKKIRSGYTAEALRSETGVIHQKDAHEGFQSKWN